MGFQTKGVEGQLQSLLGWSSLLRSGVAAAPCWATEIPAGDLSIACCSVVCLPGNPAASLLSPCPSSFLSLWTQECARIIKPKENRARRVLGRSAHAPLPTAGGGSLPSIMKEGFSLAPLTNLFPRHPWLSCFFSGLHPPGARPLPSQGVPNLLSPTAEVFLQGSCRSYSSQGCSPASLALGPFSAQLSPSTWSQS